MSCDELESPVGGSPAKRCARCHVMKPLNSFSRARDTRDGRGSYCKQCAVAYNRDRRLNGPTLCAVDGCGQPIVAKHWCQHHYDNQRRWGDVHGPWRDANPAGVVTGFNREELAWAAGFWDGEGCATYSHRENVPRATLSQKEPQLLHRLVDALQLRHRLKTAVYESHGKSSACYSVQVLGYENVQFVACVLWPWLGPHKRRQFAQVLTAHNAGRRPLKERIPRNRRTTGGAVPR